MSTGRTDVVIPLAFPDYRITWEVKGWKYKVSYLGHAGVLFISGRGGVTKYYEYGRYPDPAGRHDGRLGRVKRRPIPNVVLGRDRHATRASLTTVLARLGRTYGRAQGAYIAVPGKYDAILRYVVGREAQNKQPNRRPYSAASNSCMHFANDAVKAGGVASSGWMLPSPVDWIEDLRDDHPDFNFRPGTKALSIRWSGKREESLVPHWATEKSLVGRILEGDW